jgi:hypothetical protein
VKGTAFVALGTCAWMTVSCGGQTYDAGTHDSGTLPAGQVSPTATSSGTSSASAGATSTVATSVATSSGTAVDAASLAQSTLSDGGSSTAWLSSTADATVLGEPPPSAGADAAADASNLQPPLVIPGLALWLDAEAGLTTDGGTGFVSWADRSGLGNVFMGGECSSPGVGALLRGRPAVSFGGHDNILVEGAPSAAQQAALTLGDTFVLSVVFQQHGALESLGGNEDVGIMVAAYGPWFGDCPIAPEVGPLSGQPPLLLEVYADGHLTLDVAGQERLSFQAGNLFAPHLLIVAVSPAGTTARLDGQAVVNASDGGGAFASPTGYVPQYAPIYVGDWDVGVPGFPGAIGDVVLIQGDGGGQIAHLESYLLAKYAF